jgi:glycosyltransferase involved in cell wall biosynthesis
VEVQSGWVDDLVDLFNNAAVYLYDSADYWRGRGVSEGFGLPPLEALACGCVVFSSLNHALADFLDPGVVGHQIGAGTLQGDLERIARAVREPWSWQPDQAHRDALLAVASEQELVRRWDQALGAIDGHWDRLLACAPALRPPSRLQLRGSQALRRFSSVLQRWRG